MIRSIPFILMAYFAAQAHYAYTNDCSIKATEDASLAVYFYGIKNQTFTSDEEVYMARCKKQLDAADFLLCYARRCLTGRGQEFVKRLIRASQYEFMHICHPHADPAKKTAFKGLQDCQNTNYPKFYKCDREFGWNLAAVVTDSGVDIARLCCVIPETVRCFVNGAAACSPEERSLIYGIGSKFKLDAQRMMCSGTPYFDNITICDKLSPVDKSGRNPPEIFTSLAKIANAL